jgi:hypothetical protein
MMGGRREPVDRAQARRELRQQVLLYAFVILLFGGIGTVVILAALGVIGHTVPYHPVGHYQPEP